MQMRPPTQNLLRSKTLARFRTMTFKQKLFFISPNLTTPSPSHFAIFESTFILKPPSNLIAICYILFSGNGYSCAHMWPLRGLVTNVPVLFCFCFRIKIKLLDFSSYMPRFSGNGYSFVPIYALQKVLTTIIPTLLLLLSTVLSINTYHLNQNKLWFELQHQATSLNTTHLK